MLTIDVPTQIHRPAHEVFAFLADFTERGRESPVMHGGDASPPLEKRLF